MKRILKLTILVTFILNIFLFSGCTLFKKKEKKVVKLPVEKPIEEKYDELYKQPIEKEKTEEERLSYASQYNSLFSDNKARHVGDLVAVIIRENASAQQTTSDSRNKNGTLTGAAGTGFLNFLPEMSASGKTSLANSGTTKRSGNLTARVSARIIKIDKYGNLLLKGNRKVLINNEIQEIEIEGFVRSEDIAVDNSIESSYLADARVKYNGKLVFDGKANPGVISNVLGSLVGFFF
ncbi:flagellar basal body L-ring protein FlgH [Haliovirga abyssi]|uniref:Basal body L-ring protein n=1 Tax=Haliovirga abyssi TaxID=2996794 RepID=A0AAU9D9F8_9FUSO|nr:flagellar basal body L-ring protein FlgH [Haliovirga abyssi]BDU50226.1 hypothetical protein HLVA_07950 [Haliovirga abyssi]